MMCNLADDERLWVNRRFARMAQSTLGSSPQGDMVSNRNQGERTGKPLSPFRFVGFFISISENNRSE